MQVLAGTPELLPRAEIGDVDDERVALPAPARIARPLPHRGCRLRSAGNWNDAREPLSLTRIVVDRHDARRLDDPIEPVPLWQQPPANAGQATLGPRPLRLARDDHDQGARLCACQRQPLPRRSKGLFRCTERAAPGAPEDPGAIFPVDLVLPRTSWPPAASEIVSGPDQTLPLR